MKIIGRTEELQKLKQLYSQKKARLAVLTGRRRIGKSYLVEYFAKSLKSDKVDFFEFQGLAPFPDAKKIDQLQNFSDQLCEQFKLPKIEFKNWTEAFSFLDEQVQKHKKVVLYLDEISWMASGDPQFVGKLKIAWDTKFKHHSHLVVILCGSVSSWIYDNILNKTDFFGRISLSLNIQPLPLNLLSEFWGGFQSKVSNYEKLRLLCITGGVPRYLEEIDPKMSTDQDIQRLCFDKDGYLFQDFEKIFNDIFNRRAKVYKSILVSLIDGKKNLNRICRSLKIKKTGTMTKYLKDLELSGFLTQEVLHGFDGKKTRQILYRIKDNYIRFYLKYISPNHEKIQKGYYKFNSLSGLSQSEQVLGLQFESLILNNTDLILKSLNIDKSDVIWGGPYLQSKNLKNKAGCQIDLMIMTNRNTIYVCEIKFRKKIDSSVIEDMKRKIKVLKRPKHLTVRPVLIYVGQIASSVHDEAYFDHILCGEDILNN
jgi:uncharacterized protein